MLKISVIIQMMNLAEFHSNMQIIGVEIIIAQEQNLMETVRNCQNFRAKSIN